MQRWTRFGVLYIIINIINIPFRGSKLRDIAMKPMTLVVIIGILKSSYGVRQNAVRREWHSNDLIHSYDDVITWSISRWEEIVSHITDTVIKYHKSLNQAHHWRKYSLESSKLYQEITHLSIQVVDVFYSLVLQEPAAPLQFNQE